MQTNRLITELKIIQHNVLSWTRERAIELSNYYNAVKPDIILLNSISQRDNSKVKIFNYNIYTKNYLNEQHAGIAIGIRKDANCRILDDFTDDLLGIQVETTKGPIAVFTIYSPPRRNYLPVGELKRALQKTIPVYFIGDMNAHHPTLGYRYTDNKGKIIQELIDRNIAKHLGPDFPTLIGRNGKPDIVLSNRHNFLNMVIEAGSITSSDHLPLIIRISTKPILKEKQSSLNYKKADWEKFQKTIEENITLTNMNNKTKADIDHELMQWADSIQKATETSIPKNKNNYHIHPQESDFLKILENLYIQLKNLDSWDREQLNIIKNIQELIKQENVRLYNERWSEKISKLQEIYNNPQKFWRDVGNLMGGKKNSNTYIVKANGEKLHTEKEKEKEFRSIWSNIFRIDEGDNVEFDQQHERHVLNYLAAQEYQLGPFERTDMDRLDPNNYLTRPVTNNDIINIIKEFKNKAPGKSGISRPILLKLPNKAIEKFKNIINATISIGYFPVIFKNGIIILIPKPGKDPKDPLNYRPITLLEIPAKILERIINNRFQKYCETNGIFHQNQYGFRKGRGTDIALTKIHELIAINQKWKDHANIVCRDISKAFDKVWTEGLKYKLVRQEELPQIIKKILSSYVTDRTAQIRLNTYLGEKFSLKSGVPQGGILSPTMFIFYTSDIPRSGPNCTDIIFADDITQIIENFNNDKTKLAEDTAKEVERINNYENKWKIKTNITKFKLMSVSKLKPAKVEIENREINFANECSILGLKLKRTGTISHLTERINKAKTQTQTFKRFINLETKTKLHLYKALVRPIPSYSQCLGF